MREDWMGVGREYTADREAVRQACDEVEWHSLPCTLGMCPGMAIESMVEQLRIPKVSRVGVGHRMAPFGLCAVEGHYKNGRAEVFALDVGTDIVPLVVRFYPDEG